MTPLTDIQPGYGPGNKGATAVNGKLGALTRAAKGDEQPAVHVQRRRGTGSIRPADKLRAHFPVIHELNEQSITLALGFNPYYLLPATVDQPIPADKKVMLGGVEIEYGEKYWQRPGIQIGHGAMWHKGNKDGKTKGLSVRLYLTGRSGKQTNYANVYLGALKNGQFEIHTSGAHRGTITLAEWQAFIDTVEVRVSDVSKNTVGELTPELVKMARDVIARRRQEPTDAEWKEELAQKAADKPELPIMSPAKPAPVVELETAELYEALTIRSGGCFGDEYHAPKSAPAVQPQALQSPDAVQTEISRVARKLSMEGDDTSAGFTAKLSQKSYRPTAAIKEDLADMPFNKQEERVIGVAKELAEAVRYIADHPDNHEARNLPYGYKLRENGAWTVLCHPAAPAGRVIVACQGIYDREDTKVWETTRAAIEKLVWAVERGPAQMKHPALATMDATVGK